MPKVHFGKNGAAFVMKYGKKVYLSKFGGLLDNLTPDELSLIIPKLSVRDQASLRRTSISLSRDPSLTAVSENSRWPILPLQQQVMHAATGIVDGLIISNLSEYLISLASGQERAKQSVLQKDFSVLLKKTRNDIIDYSIDNYVWAGEFYDILNLDNVPHPRTRWYLPFVKKITDVYMKWVTGRGVVFYGPIESHIVPWADSRITMINKLANLMIKSIPVENLRII